MARRRRERPDPYEYAAAQLQADRTRRDMGDPIPDLPPGLDAPLPGTRLRRTGLVLAAVLAVLVLGRTAAHRPTAANCGTPALSLSDRQVTVDDGLRWTATGPRDTRVRLELDGRVVSKPGTTLASCRAEGFFVVRAPVGAHTVALVGADGRRLATAPLTVVR